MQLSMKRQQLAKGLLTFASVMLALFIFSNSLQTADASGEKSGFLTGLANQILGGLGLPLQVTDHIIRKLGHFSEFALFGALLTVTLRAYTPQVIRNLFAPLFLGLLTGVMDEFIQLFSVGRSSEVRDVLIDFSGVVTGVLLVLAVLALMKRRKTHSAKDKKAP